MVKNMNISINLWKKLKMYKCESPICNGYITKYRSQIHYHHIIPIESGGHNKPSNRIYLCPNCHVQIFIQSSKHGIHSIKGSDSIILIGWVSSTKGRLLEYIDQYNNHQYIEDKNNS